MRPGTLIWLADLAARGEAAAAPPRLTLDEISLLLGEANACVDRAIDPALPRRARLAALDRARLLEKAVTIATDGYYIRRAIFGLPLQ